MLAGGAGLAGGQDGGAAQPVPQSHHRAPGWLSSLRWLGWLGRLSWLGWLRRVAHLHGVDHVTGHHESVAPVDIAGIGPPPGSLIGNPALHVAVVGQHRRELDDPGLALRVGVLDGVGDDLHHRQMQRLPVLGGDFESAQPVGEGVPRDREAGSVTAQFQVQGRHRVGQPLRGQGGDVIRVTGAGQQFHGELAHSLSRGGGRVQGQYPVGGRVGGDGRELGHSLRDGPVRPFYQPVAVQQHQLTRGEHGAGQGGC